MSVLDTVLAYIYLGLAVVMFLVEVFAFFEAARGSAQLYDLHNKLSKPAWMAITGVAMAFGLLGVLSGGRASFGLFSIVAITASGVFLADVRPLVCPTRGGRSSHGSW